jgi:hypothetical protein
MINPIDSEMYEFCQRLRGRACRIEVGVNFQHWIPRKPTHPYTVTLECADGPVTLRTTGEGTTLREAISVAQKQICAVLDREDDTRKRRAAYAVEVAGAGHTSGAGVGADTRGRDTASYKENSTVPRAL